MPVTPTPELNRASILKEITDKLKQPFPVAAHKERSLPGGGRWFYIPWQEIRNRLDEVYPAWEVAYSEPKYLGDYCHITCTIVIEKISRSAPGNAPIQLLSSSGKDMSRGTPVERAIADAFKNASEAWGVAQYLDDQAFVVKYMQSKGDMRGYKYATENNQIEAGVRGVKSKVVTPINKKIEASDPLPSPVIDRNLINSEIDSILKRKAIAKETAIEMLFAKYQVKSRQQLTDQQLQEFLQLLQLKPNLSVVQNAL